MKVKEALEEFNQIDKCKALVVDSVMEGRAIYVCADKYANGDGIVNGNWILKFPIHTSDITDVVIGFNEAVTDGIGISQMIEILQIVKKLLSTPAKNRLDEPKYRLRWIDDSDFSSNFIGRTNVVHLNAPDGKGWGFVTPEDSAALFTGPQLEQLKKEYPRWAPAIDAMKERVEDNE